MEKIASDSEVLVNQNLCGGFNGFLFSPLQVPREMIQFDS